MSAQLLNTARLCCPAEVPDSPVDPTCASRLREYSRCTAPSRPSPLVSIYDAMEQPLQVTCSEGMYCS